MGAPSVPLLPFRETKSWPKHVDARAVEYMALDEVLTTAFPTDAHFAAYSLPAKTHRLSKEYLTLGLDPVAMVAAVFDVDDPAAHTSNAPARAAWRKSEQRKIAALVETHPGAVIYPSRGGYRPVYLLEQPVVLRTPDDAEQWTRLYGGWINYLRRRFGIVADRACAQWTRLYRAPYVRRDGVDERRELLHDPDTFGFWKPQLARVDLPPAPAKVRSFPPPTDVGVLPALFGKRGWLGERRDVGTWLAKCPWSSEHTGGEDFDSSTLMYGASPGQRFGRLFCMHAHCTDAKTLKCKHTVRDCLAQFTADELRSVGVDPATVVRAAQRDAIRRWSARR